MIEYPNATREHAKVIATNLRSEDIREAYSASGMTPYGALLSSLMASEEAYTVVRNGTPIGMFGVSMGEVQDLGIPWLLGTPELTKVPIELVKMGREMCASWSSLYGTLVNAVHFENETSMQWLEAIGFSLIEVLDNYGVQQERFYVYALNV